MTNENKFTLTYGLSKANLPLIPIAVQDKHLFMLLDTGSNINILDTKVYNHFFNYKSRLWAWWNILT